MAMPHAGQLVSCVEALPIVHQDQVCGVKAIVAINLDEQLGGHIETRLDQRNALVEHDQVLNVSPPLGLVV